MGDVPLIALVALDLDGTLLGPNDSVSPANRRAIQATLELGVRVVLVTGRGVDFPEVLARELDLQLPIICAHGALTKDFVTGRILGHIPVPLQYARPMVEFAQRHRLDVGVYVGERFYRLEGTHPYMQDMIGPHWVDVPSLAAQLGEAPTFVRFLGRRSVEAMRGEFSDLPLDFKYETWGDFEECAVTSPEATKENALARLCADLNVPQPAVFAVGDSPNDVPMLRWAGIGVAMGNATESVRSAADYVTGTNVEDGVARAIERFVLDPGGKTSRWSA